MNIQLAPKSEAAQGFENLMGKRGGRRCLVFKGDRSGKGSVMNIQLAPKSEAAQVFEKSMY